MLYLLLSKKRGKQDHKSFVYILLKLKMTLGLYLTVSAGVSKAIVTAAGPSVQAELAQSKS